MASAVAARLMPAQLMDLMRHESIETTLRFSVGADAVRRVLRGRMRLGEFDPFESAA